MSKILKGVEALRIEFQETESFRSLEDFFAPKAPEKKSLKKEDQILWKLAEKAYREGYREGLEEGRTAGFEKGYAEGRARAEKEAQALRARLEKEYGEKRAQLDQLLASLQEEISRGVLSLDREVLALLKLLVQKLFFREFLRDESVILRVVREALREVVEGSRVTVRVHPREARILQETDLRALSEKTFPEIRVEADPSISPGGCLLETDFGLVDATLERRWTNLLRALEEAAEGES
ncbi:hypothetical protein FVE67_08680 [Thermosulfurimonas marina]|uniref:Flagellar assembly protein FliH n=1 Tax=Thermosulfurimonas marina TaxID=2047767 RepID=A0A6H1WUJ6_9BACT|nr:FliH/SctL family protein [Thermosulfurimonas marina]QJA06858.1 hypothetical protein FVE67_08680 [Thermosulfurimonas marina]